MVSARCGVVPVGAETWPIYIYGAWPGRAWRSLAAMLALCLRMVA